MDAETEPRVDTPPVAEGPSEVPEIPLYRVSRATVSDAPPAFFRGPSHRPQADRASQMQQIPSLAYTRGFWTGLGIWGVGFVLAFWLSWNTNTNWNRGLFAKLSYGVGAGVHSWSYLLLWLMYIWGRHDPAAFVAKVATVMPVDVVA